jgi:beta-glucosidase
LEAARESIILAKNERNSLPIAAGRRLLVTGPTCNKLRVLNGGWSYTWQGNIELYYQIFGRSKLTIFDAIKQTSTDAIFVEGVNFTHVIDIQAAVNAAQNVDQIILCIGEDTYTENVGNINDLTLSEPQVNFK